MKRVIFAFIKYYLFWVVYFTFFKVFFVLYNYPLLADLPMADQWGIFSHGIIMDLSVAGYLSLLPGLVFGLGFLFISRFSTYLLKYYTLLLLVLMTVLGLSDIGIFEPWGSRLNAQVLEYLKTPGGIYASLTWWQVILFPVLWIGLVWGSMWIYNRVLPQKKLRTMHMKWYGIPVVLFLTAALIIPIRGGFDRSPLNHSSVYFSPHLKANQSAYNYCWNMIHSILT